MGAELAREVGGEYDNEVPLDKELVLNKIFKIKMSTENKRKTYRNKESMLNSILVSDEENKIAKDSSRKPVLAELTYD